MRGATSYIRSIFFGGNPATISEREAVALKERGHDEHNAPIAADMAPVIAAFAAHVRANLPSDKRDAKKIEAALSLVVQVVRPPPNYEATWRKRCADYDAAVIAEREKKERTAAVERDRRDAANAAANAAGMRTAFAFLTARGWTVTAAGWLVRPDGGVTCSPTDAPSFADDVAYTEAKAAALESTDGCVSFSGDDSCEGCSGWDGNDRRCSCGNRRVSWCCEGGFEAPYVYAEAW